MYIPPIEEYNQKYIYESIETEEFPGLDVPVYKIKGLHFNGIPGKESIQIPGQSYLTAAASLFYHSMIDTVGHYEMLKSKYPGLKINFCTRDNYIDFKKHIMLGDIQVIDVLHTYETPGLVWEILDFNNNNYLFEEVIFLPNHGPTYSYRMIPKDLHDNLPYIWEDLLPLRVEASKYLKNKFKDKLIKTKSKKIYSARKQYAPGVQIDESRIYDEEDKIIDYFIKLGYEIVNLQGMKLIDQFNLFYNASEIAGIKGTNLFCSIFAEPGTKVIQIYNSGFWSYQFENYFLAHGLIPIDIAQDQSRNLPHDPEAPRLSADIIIAELDKYFNQEEIKLSNSSDITSPE